ncbi:MAG TPA: c-type cytochrome [Myxococcota bacterium]|jgi:mono/diheme cytochrome c family protein|nr:c-type cytochrome [Myxococcota bacterium]
MRGAALGTLLLAGAAAAAVHAPRTAAAHMGHGPVIKGSVVYQRLCASCHGAKGYGDGPRAADSLARPADLTHLPRRSGGGLDRARVAAALEGPGRLDVHGTRDAAVWGEPGLGPPGPDGAPSAKLTDLLDYLEHIQSTR